MPAGKPAGVRCIQLDDQLHCRLFGQPQRPAVCVSLRPSAAMCGADRRQAIDRLMLWEQQTAPVTVVRSTRSTAFP